MKPTRVSNYVAVGFILLFWLSAFSNYFANLGHVPKIDLNPSLLIQLALSNTFITIAFVVVFMRLGKEQPRDIGFRHERLGQQLLIGAVVCVAIVTLAILLTAAGTSSLLTLTVLAMTAVALALFSALTVEVGNHTLTCRFGVGLIRRDIPLQDVEQIRAVVNPWYVGWGIRWIPGKYWVWNVSGFQAVELTMKDGRRFRIGTDEPEALVHAIEMAKNTGS